MELFRDRRMVEEFLSSVGSLLHKMDIYLDTVHSDDLSQTVARKRQELIESLRFMKSYFLSNRFPQEMSRPERRVSDSNNNNNSAPLPPSAAESIQTEQDPCLCTDLQTVCVISRLLDVSAARQSHFSSALLDRMRNSDNHNFAVYRTDILISEHSGWLSVDEEHKYYVIVSDCLLCLFESEMSPASLMTAILNDSHSQVTESSLSQNAFTISVQQEVLYFCANSSEDRTDWIKWLNVGAQLPFESLIRHHRQSTTSDMDTQTDVSSCKQPTDKTEHLTKPTIKSTDTVDTSAVDLPDTVQMREKAPVLRRQAKTRERTQSAIIDNERMRTRNAQNSSLRPASSYDWTLDQGTSRHFPSRQDLELELGNKKVSTYQKGGTAAPRQKFSLPADTSRPQYIDSRRPKISLQNMKSVSFEEKPSPSWGSKLVRRASSLFISKTGSFKVTSEEKRQESIRSSLNSIPARLSQDMGVASSGRSSSLPSVNMAELCEVQGYLLYKKTLKWVMYYCCVYNGTFSCFKDQKSSLPEVQCLLSRCRVIPMKAKKPFSFKLMSDTKSAYFAAVSDADLHAWYTVFNNYIRGALDLPMVEKTSADGASHHSDDSCSSREVRQRKEVRGDRQHNQKASKADKKVSFERGGGELEVVGSRLSCPVETAAVMRSVSESDYKPFKHARRLMTQKSLSQYFCRSVDDVSGLGSSNSSSGEEEVSTGVTVTKPKKTHEERRKNLLDKMMKEKLRIELALEQQKRKDDEENENEIVVNMTKLQQRRVSTQLKYAFLEKQLQEKKEDKPKYSGLFPKSNKAEKVGKVVSATVVSAMAVVDTTDSSQHIRQQMEELKHKLDSLDKVLGSNRLDGDQIKAYDNSK